MLSGQISICYILVCIYMQNHNDTLINRWGKPSLENIYLSIYLQGSKGLCGVLLWEGAGDQTELQYIDPYSYGRQRCVFLVLRGCSTGGPLCWVMAFFTASYQQLLRTPTQSGAPRAPSAWRSFPYHISSLPQLPRGSKGPFGLVWPSLPHLV